MKKLALVKSLLRSSMSGLVIVLGAFALFSGAVFNTPTIRLEPAVKGGIAEPVKLTTDQLDDPSEPLPLSIDSLRTQSKISERLNDRYRMTHRLSRAA